MRVKRKSGATVKRKSGATKRASSQRPKTMTPRAFAQFAENGAAQTSESYEKMSAATAQGSNGYTTAAQSAMKYNAKLIDIACANANAAFDYTCELSGVKSPAQFLEVTSEHARRLFGVYTEQSRELAALAQRLASEAVVPLRAGLTNAFQGHVS